MEKLMAALKCANDDELQAELVRRVYPYYLEKGEDLPAGLERGTWIFVESGLIKKTFFIKNYI
jgi:hypothetical protein